jgi:hypothetical protein
VAGVHQDPVPGAAVGDPDSLDLVSEGTERAVVGVVYLGQSDLGFLPAEPTLLLLAGRSKIQNCTA